MNIQSLLIQAGFILVLGIAVVGAFEGVKYGRTLLKLKIGAEKYAQLEAQAQHAIQALEQVGKNLGLTGEQKKSMAKASLVAIASALKIKLTDEEIDHIIESLVYVINLETGTFEQPAG